jgi:hypothetical protein
METTTGTLVYTAEELQRAIESVQADTRISQSRIIGVEIFNIFKREVIEGNLDHDYALGLYNEIAQMCGFDEVDAIRRTYSATVSYQGEVVLELTSIEANDEDDAKDKIESDLTVEEATLSFTVSYGMDSQSADVAYSDSDILAELEVEVEEE